MEHFDVAIVGAGPAGSSAAIALARRGYSVALLDKEQFPREKLCGDFLNPINWPLLRELEVDREILARFHQKVTTFRFTSFSGEQAEVPLPDSEDGTLFGLGVRRFDLDYVLIEKARSLGVTVRDGWKLKELKREPNRWRLRAGKSETLEDLAVAMLVGADGRNSWVAHHLGMTASAAMQGRAIGFQLRLKCLNLIAGKVEIHLFPGGYAGLVGLGGNMLNLCLAVDKARFQHHQSLDRLLESYLSLNPHLEAILRRSQPVGAARSVYPVYFSPRRSYGHGVLLVGDAARVNEPVTGEGIYCALKSGELAARTIDQAFRKSDFSVDHLCSYGHGVLLVGDAARVNEPVTGEGIYCALKSGELAARTIDQAFRKSVFSVDHLCSYERECRLTFRTRWRINALIRWLIYRPALLSPLIRVSRRRQRLLDSLVHTICQPEAAR